jgi:hypothetical protein
MFPLCSINQAEIALAQLPSLSARQLSPEGIVNAAFSDR